MTITFLTSNGKFIYREEGTLAPDKDEKVILLGKEYIVQRRVWTYAVAVSEVMIYLTEL